MKLEDQTLTEFTVEGWECSVVIEDDAVWYSYQREEDGTGFRFSLLCEVGQSFIPWFRAAIRRAGYSVTRRTRSLEGYPYLTNVLRKLPSHTIL